MGCNDAESHGSLKFMASIVCIEPCGRIRGGALADLGILNDGLSGCFFDERKKREIMSAWADV